MPPVDYHGNDSDNNQLHQPASLGFHSGHVVARHVSQQTGPNGSLAVFAIGRGKCVQRRQ
jgi:hypothetical protein